MLLDTHNCSWARLKFSSFIRVMVCKKVEKGIGKSVWNFFFQLILINHAQRQLEIIGGGCYWEEKVELAVAGLRTLAGGTAKQGKDR